MVQPQDLSSKALLFFRDTDHWKQEGGTGPGSGRIRRDQSDLTLTATFWGACCIVEPVCFSRPIRGLSLSFTVKYRFAIRSSGLI
jgi:hypothetical protein